MRTFLFVLIYTIVALISAPGVAQSTAEEQRITERSEVHDDVWENSSEELFAPRACKKASSKQIAQVNLGNTKTEAFLQKCAEATNSSPWCKQLVRPNPASLSVFQCTYGKQQVHQLVHPDEKTWKNAFTAVKLVEELERSGINACLIYNWWRPEPYNGNVGGAAGRHPLGTSVDVRFCTMADMEKAFLQLCKWRAQGHVRAVGYYGTTGLHFGIADKAGNTWGKSCPSFRPVFAGESTSEGHWN